LGDSETRLFEHDIHINMYVYGVEVIYIHSTLVYVSIWHDVCMCIYGYVCNIYGYWVEFINMHSINSINIYMYIVLKGYIYIQHWYLYQFNTMYVCVPLDLYAIYMYIELKYIYVYRVEVICIHSTLIHI